MRVFAALSLAAFALAGCAKFPENGTTQYTRMHFTITYSGAIDSRYLYFVAIRRITSSAQINETYGPIPVVTTGSKNGIVEGRPTQLIQYDRNSTRFFTVSTFLTRTPTENDPNPIELAAPRQTSEAISGADPEAGGAGSVQSRVLDFEISTQDLARNADGTNIDPASIIGIQFNILSMDRTALTSPGTRVMDALGNQRNPAENSFNTYRYIPIQSGDTFRNNNPTNPFPETEGDTYNGTLPAIDLTDWTVDVRTQ